MSGIEYVVNYPQLSKGPGDLIYVSFPVHIGAIQDSSCLQEIYT